jgi:hypothetical protein
MADKQITKLHIGASIVTIVTPINVFDTSVQEMLDDHYRLSSAIVAIGEEIHAAAVFEMKSSIEGMRARGMFK